MTRQKIKARIQFFSEILGHHHVADEKRQRALGFAALGFEHTPNSVQIQRVGNKRVKRVTWNGYDAALTDELGGTGNRDSIRLFSVNFNKICGHRQSSGVSFGTA